MKRSNVFPTEGRQIIRLPKAVALPDHVKLVDIAAIGPTRIISPAGDSWDSWFDGEAATEDFMKERA
jgi:antitoxin VapB